MGTTLAVEGEVLDQRGSEDAYSYIITSGALGFRHCEAFVKDVDMESGDEVNKVAYPIGIVGVSR